jgi:ATP-dependent Clp protease ATP-binding subunit ClpA
VREFFRPELINRLDEILVFEPLTQEQIRSIVDIQLARLQKHLDEQEIRLELTPAAKDRLAEEGYSPEFGARPLKRAIQKHVQNLLADAILTGKVKPGGKAVIDVSGDRFWIETAGGQGASESRHARARSGA